MPRPWLAAEARSRERDRFDGADFNLSRLIVGSEGTLATVVEAVLHLTPLPAARGVVVLHFDSLAHAIDAVAAALDCETSAVELFDGLILRLAEQSLEYKHYLDFVVGRPESLLLVEFSADSASVRRRPCRQACRSTLLARPVSCIRSPRSSRKCIGMCGPVRKAALPLLQGIPGARKPVAFVEDPAVDPQHLPQFVERFREILARYGTDGAFYGHASSRLSARATNARFVSSGRHLEPDQHLARRV